jgi:sugar O-acyltransferase (sialic acid O-acetyltransferase NeuD family)
VGETPTVLGRIEAPLVNTNEPDAQVIELSLEGFSQIASGDHVCTLETSKATVEVESDLAGYVGPLTITLGDIITAGDLICEVFDAMPDQTQTAGASVAAGAAGVKMTKKAEALATELGVDPAGLPTGRFVTEKDVRAAAVAAAPVELADELVAQIHDTALVVFGGGGLGKTIIDLARDTDGYEVIGIVDDGLEVGTEVLGVPVLGGQRYLAPLAEAGLEYAANAVGAIGRIATRTRVSDLIADAGLRAAVLVEPSASIADSADLQEGVQVFAQAVVSAAARVGANTIVNSGAIVSHDCRIGANTHIAPGAILAGEVTVGEGTLIGMGVTASVGLSIGAHVVVGNGSVLSADVPDGTFVSAGTVWTGDRS